ncbi:MAG: glycosyltransferase family 1 protein [Patescibacteria group bacterium]
MKILIDTSPLDTGHAIRGIGTYTRLLTEYLEKRSDILLVRSGTKKAENFNPDLVHYPYFDLFFSTLPIIKKHPTVLTIHDVIPLIFPNEYPPGLKGRARFIKQKSALKNIKAIITDSNSSKKDIQKHLGISSEKINVVYLAANPDLKKVNEKEIRRVKRKYKLPKNYVLYVGDINYNKNIPQLIKATRSLPQHVKLLCLGKSFIQQDIPEWHWIETQLALSNVVSKVKFLSNVPGGAITDMAAIYSGALCYVQPSLYEGFGLPVLEAMACQTPVVSTNASSLTEVGGDFAVYVNQDAESIASGINKVLTWNKTKRQQKIKAALIWSKNFDWEKTAQETANVYKKVLND